MSLQISLCLTCATLTMLRIWMLVTGAAAVRQVAEDALAHSAVKEGSIGPISYIRKKWQTSRLRSEVKEVAKKNFPEEEGQNLTEAVMEAFKDGELDEDKLRRSWDEKSLYLFAIMKEERNEKRLRSAVEEVAKKFPEKERPYLTAAVMKAFKKGELDKGLTNMSWENTQKYLVTKMQTMRAEYFRRDVARVAENFPEKEREHLTEAVMKAFENGELDEGKLGSNRTRVYYLLATMQKMRELPVAASAIKFCANLFRQANHFDWDVVKASADAEAREAAGICHEVLTGHLGPGGPKWAEEAAKSSQPKDQHLKRGRLEKVDAVETAWKVSLDNVCRDECHALVKEMKNETFEIFKDVNSPERPPSFEEVCAKRVVQKVEAEILGCCAESCGWNGRACMYWPFLSSTEKGQWEAECCTEFNILKNSSRATMCDATLTGKENNEVIRDEQPNTEEEREMIGQDPVLKGASFLQEEGTNGPSPPPENKPIPAPEGTCPPPLDLGKIHEKLKHEWKTTNFQLARKKNFKKEFCLQKKLKDSIGNCTAFLPQDENSTYMCYGHCLVSGEGLKFTNLTAEIPSNSQLLYVHETIYKTNGE